MRPCGRDGRCAYLRRSVCTVAAVGVHRRLFHGRPRTGLRPAPYFGPPRAAGPGLRPQRGASAAACDARTVTGHLVLRPERRRIPAVRVRAEPHAPRSRPAARAPDSAEDGSRSFTAMVTDPPPMELTRLLLRGVQKPAAGLLAESAGLGADPAVPHVSMPLALVTAALADGHAGLQQRPGDVSVVACRAADDRGGSRAHIGAVQAQPDAPDHLGHALLS